MITALKHLYLVLEGKPSTEDISDLTKEDHVAVRAIRRIAELTAMCRRYEAKIAELEEQLKESEDELRGHLESEGLI